MNTKRSHRLDPKAPAAASPVRRRLGGLYAPELLESRIAPATFLVTSLLDDGSEGTLRKEITDANLAPGADTIVFKLADPLLPHTIVLNGTEIAITGTLTIKGPGVDLLTVSGANASRIFNIADGDNTVLHPTAISGLTLTDGNFGGAGGAIFSSESLALTNVVVHSSYAGSSGGGVFVVTLGKVSLSKVTLTENFSALGAGGGLFVQAEGGILISKSVVSGNSARRDGGGLYLSAVNPKASFVIDGTSFIDNTSTNVGGGGLALNHAGSGKITVKNSTFTGNTAAGLGGGIHLADGSLSVDRVIFSGNTAGAGGAIGDNFGDGLKIANSRFEGNLSSEDGGALLTRGSLVNIAGSIFSGNDAALRGGAIHVSNGGTLTIKGTTLSGNTATGNGGAISLADAGTSLVLATSTVSGNAGVDGGGIFADTGARLTVTGGVFSGNTASSEGGGIATEGNAPDAVNVIISGTLLQGNRAAFGGAMDTDGAGTVLIKGARVLGNHATDTGGGMYLRSSTSVVIQSSLFAQNVAGSGDGGGAVIDLDAVAARGTITGSKFLDNFAASDSGGLGAFGAAGSVFTIKSSLISGNIAATQAGGMRIAGTTVDLIATVIAGNWAPVAPNVFP